MPRVDPEPLRPYIFHGIDLQWNPNDRQALADCPFCGRENKFSVNIETGQWRCFVCAEGTEKGGGNALIFLRKLHGLSWGLVTSSEAVLAEDRGVDIETLRAWGVSQSSLTDDWMVPGYNSEGNLMTLYVRKQGTLYPTPTMGHAVFGGNLFDTSKPIVDVAEGPWDGMALWESLRSHKQLSDGSLALTGSESSSLLADRSVVAIPGLGSIGEPMKKWAGFFRDKVVNLWFDSDHPKRTCTQGHKSYSTVHTYMTGRATGECCPECGDASGRDIMPAGYAGVLRAGSILAGVASEVNYCRWGEDGFDPELKSGQDLRDELCQR